MLSGSDHVKVSETKWQYRKNRCLPGHVKKGKQAAFCLFFSFSIYDSEVLLPNDEIQKLQPVKKK